MAVSDRHKITVEDEIPNAKYSYVVKCSCGWVGRCYTVEESDKLANGHLNNQGILTETGGIRSGGL
jgi:hypothetical protein